VIEDDCTIANGCLLAGHTHLEEAVTLGGNAALAPFVRVGAIAFVAAGARVEQDVPPYHVVQGDRARVRALNVVGLERRSVDQASRAALAAAHAAIYRSESPIAVAAGGLEAVDPFVRRLVEFLLSRTTVPGPSRRGYPPRA
jgi:UDP-N-acetylglucosamine acyltransferase